MEEHRHTKWSEIRARRLSDPKRSAAYQAADRAIKLGEQVRHLRETRGMSQADLARRMATSQSAIARLEAGGVDPKVGTLERLSRALDADLIVELRAPAPVA
jgi:ribosome-binding protein aMBF1 (putative translation factor)